MILHTMGFAKKPARTFFGLIQEHRVDALIDVRINNTSQLAGFAKSADLAYFLEQIAHIPYVYEPAFAPTKELLKVWRDGSITWDGYVDEFSRIMDERKVSSLFAQSFAQYERPLLLCSEPTPEHCHRRLLAERFVRDLGEWLIEEVVHL